MFGLSGKPELVQWDLYKQGHSSDEAGGKNVFYGDIFIGVSEPQFSPDSTWISVFVSNYSRKALGFSAQGFGLVLGTGLPKSKVPCIGLKYRTKKVDEDGFSQYEEQIVQNLMVNANEKNSSFVAEFQPVAKPNAAELVIQGNRILARPILFYFPFDLSAVKNDGLQGINAPQPKAVLVFCCKCSASLQRDDQFCRECGAPQFQRLAR